MNIFKCGICLERYDQDEERVPRLLAACGHTICENCALKIMKDSKLLCPFDRIENDIPDGNVKLLKKNFAILEAIQKLQYVIKRAETDDVTEYEEDKSLGLQCDEDSTHIAVLYCTVCKSHYCNICAKSSHIPKSLSSHRMVKITEKPDTLLMCPLHEYNVAELYCQDEGCNFASKITCSRCHLDGVHKGHEYKSIDEILEIKKAEALELLTTTNSKRECVKYHIDTIGDIPNRVENDEEYKEAKSHILKTHMLCLRAAEAWKYVSLELVGMRTNEKLQQRKKEKEKYHSKLEELDALAKKCLDATKQGKNEYFKRAKDLETAAGALNSYEIEEPAEMTNLMSLVRSPTLCGTTIFATHQLLRKIVIVDHRPEFLRKNREICKQLAGFKQDMNEFIHMEDQLGNPFYVYFCDDKTFESFPIHVLENTTFVVLYLNKTCLEKMMALSKESSIILSWPKVLLLDADEYEEYRSMWNQFSAPIFVADCGSSSFIKYVCHGNYSNNSFFQPP